MASDYDDLIAQAAKDYDVPLEILTQLIESESGRDPTAVSKKGALGVAQFMPETAKALGINPLIPAQAIPGSAKYIRQHYDEFKDWELAAAAYNAGPSAVRKYKGIPPYAETQAFAKKVAGGYKVSKAAQAQGEVVSDGFSALGLVDQISDESMSASGLVDQMFPDKIPEQKTTVADVQKRLLQETEHERVADVVLKQGERIGAPGAIGGTVGLMKGMGVETPEETDPYKMNPILTKEDVEGFMGTVGEMWKVIKDPAQVVKGTAELAASLPGYAIAGARFAGAALETLSRSKATFDEAFENAMTEFQKTADWWSKLVVKPAGQVAISPATVGKELAHKLFGGVKMPEEPVKTELIAETAFVPFTVGQAPFMRIANDPALADHPNLKGIAKFLGFAAGGALMHGAYKGGRQKFSDDALKVVKQADDALKLKSALDSTVDSAAKRAQEKIVQMQLERAEREAAAMMENLDYGEMIKQDLRSKGAAVKEAKLPKKFNLEEAIRKADEGIKEPKKLVEKAVEEPVKEVTIVKKEPVIGPKKGKPVETKVIKTEKPKEPPPPEDPVTDIDRLTGRKLPKLSTEASPFRDSPERTKFLSEEFSKSSSWKEDLELWTQKLINDVNRWLDGDDSINVEEARGQLSRLAANADEMRHNFINYGTETGGDPFLDWKDTVGEAAIWARNASRPKKGQGKLRSKIKRSEDIDVVQEPVDEEAARWSEAETREDLSKISALEKYYKKTIDQISDKEVEDFFVREGGKIDWFGEGDTLHMGVDPKQVVDLGVELLNKLRGTFTGREPSHRFADVTIPSSIEKRPTKPKKLPDIVTEFDLSKKNILPVLLKDIMNQRPARTMIYELTQNSLDALPGSGKGGKINIKFDGVSQDSNSILKFSDNGSGMSPEEVKNFMLVGGSIGKTGTTTRGGYGLAKVGIFLIPEKTTLVTTKDGMTSTVKTNREQIADGKIHIERKATPGKPNGTELTFSIPKTIAERKFETYDVTSAVDEIVGGTWTDAEIKFDLRFEDSPPDYFHTRATNRVGVLDKAPKKIDSDSFEMNGSKVNIHYVETEPYGYDWSGKGTYPVDVVVSNKGLVVDVRTADLVKVQKHPVKPDFKIVIDFEETPTVRDPAYPFLKNRTEVADWLKKPIQDLVDKKIFQIRQGVMQTKGTAFREMFERSRELSSGIKILNPLEGDKLEASNKLIDANIDLFSTFSDVTARFTEALRDSGESGTDFHLTIDPKVYGYKSNVALTGLDIYAINPIALTRRIAEEVGFKEALAKGADIVRLQADSMTHTMLHEYTHKKVFDHSESYTSELARLTVAMGHEKLRDLMLEVKKFYEKYGREIEGLGNSIDSIFRGGTGLEQYTKSSTGRGYARLRETALQRVAEKKDKGEVTLGVGLSSIIDHFKRLWSRADFERNPDKAEIFRSVAYALENKDLPGLWISEGELRKAGEIVEADKLVKTIKSIETEKGKDVEWRVKNADVLKTVTDRILERIHLGMRTEIAKENSRIASWSNGSGQWFVTQRKYKKGEEARLDANNILIPDKGTSTIQRWFDEKEAPALPLYSGSFESIYEGKRLPSEKLIPPDILTRVDQAEPHWRDAYKWLEEIKEKEEAKKSAKDKEDASLNIAIPIDKIPEVVRDVLKTSVIKAKDIFRNKELFDKTGFWFAKDGKWRYEIDDGAARYNVKQHLMHAYDSLGLVGTTLEEVLHYPELFDRFPEFKDVKVVFDKNLRDLGEFSGSTIRIRKPGDKKTLFHELQHMVNLKTGSKFKGGFGKVGFEYLKDPGEMEARLAETRMNMSTAERKRIPPWETLDDMMVLEKFTSDYRMRRSIGENLYSGIPLDELTKSVIKGADDVISYYRRSKEATRFKSGEAANRLHKELVKSIVDRSGNLRQDLLNELGDKGYKILQKAVLSKGAGALSAKNMGQMRKEIWNDLSKHEKEVLDKLILTKRMIDIGSYKRKGEFFFPEEITPEKSIMYQELFEQREKLSPEQAEMLRGKMQTYFDWMKKPLEAMLESGLISQEEFNKLVTHQYRRIKLVDILDHRYGLEIGEHKRIVYDSGVQRLARGRDTDIYEPSAEIMALETFNRAYGRVLNNEANKTLLELARDNPENPFVRVKQQKGDKIPQGWKRLFVYEDGKRLSMHVHPEVAKEWIINSPELSYKLAQTARVLSLSIPLRLFATGINWGFALANLPRDIMHAWYAARVFKDGEWKPLYNTNFPVFAMQMARDQAAAFGDAIHKRGRYDKYINEGGGMELLVHQGKLLSRGRRLEGPIDKIENLLGYFGETTELMTRLAIRERVIRRRANELGISMDEARSDEAITREASFAARDYFDFGQGGGIAKAADNAFPYLNAAIQGTRGLFRSFKENPVASTWKTAQLATITTGTFLAAWQYAPEAMRNLEGSQDMRNNFCIPLPESFAFEDENGEMRYPYFKIPLDPGQKFFKKFFEAAAQKWLGRPVDVDEVVKSLKELSPVGVSELPPSISAMLGYVTNKDFWLNEDIWKRTDKPFSWPKSKEEYIPGKTPKALIDLGQATGLSPERMQYAVEEIFTSGTIWSYLLGKGYDEVLGDLPKSKKEQHFAKSLSQIPGIKRFIGVTNPYSKHASSIEKRKEDADVEYFIQTRNLDALAEAHLQDGTVSSQEVWKFISSQKDKGTIERLTDRFTFQTLIRDLPERSFWLRLKGLKTTARAKAYMDRMNNATEKERESIRKEMPTIAGAGGVLTKEFWAEVEKLR